MCFCLKFLLLIMNYGLCVCEKTFIEYIRSERAAAYQGNYVSTEFFVTVHKGDRMPTNAVRPFERPLTFGDKRYNVAVAIWIPETNHQAIWGRAWEGPDGVKAAFVHNNTLKMFDNPDTANTFRILIYPGDIETNGFKFSWVRARDADHGAVLFSGSNRHVPAVFHEREGQMEFEFLGDSDWPHQTMEYVLYDSQLIFSVGNLPNDRLFDDSVYVLTKQRCQCLC
ncbi:hypothetical protein AB6A40_003017 [Gnathostoma spinigerum]|uniref:Uncharacterized protein n=1 Tax=Gnathostoma spinigerum TaxID=75299 RepID=A0ABD6E8E8_9BILA